MGLYFILPLIVYSFVEYYKDLKEGDTLSYLKIRYIFYNIFCFMNSTRGLMFLRAFISNEKIRINLFKYYLTSSIFYTIDRTNLKRERRFTNSSKGTFRSSTSSFLFDDNNKKINSIESESNEEEEKLLELNNKDDNAN